MSEIKLDDLIQKDKEKRKHAKVAKKGPPKNKGVQSS